MVGADLASLVNEAALAAARRGSGVVSKVDFDEAIDRQQLGLKKHGRVMSDEDPILSGKIPGYERAAQDLTNRLIRRYTAQVVKPANTKLLEREIHNLAVAKARRITIYLAVGGESSVEAIDAVIDVAEKAVAAQQGCKFARCVLSGAGAGALAYDFVYDDSSLDNDKIARNHSAILRAFVDLLGAHKLVLMRASDQAPAPLPF